LLFFAFGFAFLFLFFSNLGLDWVLLFFCFFSPIEVWIVFFDLVLLFLSSFYFSIVL